MPNNADEIDPVILEFLVIWQESRESGREIGAADLTDDPALIAVLGLAIAEQSCIEADLWGERSAPSDALGVSSRYEIVAKIGSGGMADVYEAIDLETGGRSVAYKVMQRGSSGIAALVSQFYREPKTTDALRHPGVPPIYAMVTDDSGRPAYAMELVAGVTLDGALASSVGEPSIPILTIIRRFSDASRIVDVAHGRRFVHGDLSPRNIMLLSRGEGIRVVDWGSAYDATAPDGYVRSGTPGFRDENFVSGMHPGPSMDIFSLGRCLALITEAAKPNDLASLKGRFRSSPLPALRAIVAKATAASGERYPTASSLADDLDSFLADEVISAYSEPHGDRCLRFFSRHRGSVLTGLFVALLSLGVMLTLLSRNRDLRAAEEKSRESASFYEVGAALARADSNRSQPSPQFLSAADQAALIRLLENLKGQDPQGVDSITRALEAMSDEYPKVLAEVAATRQARVEADLTHATNTLESMIRDYPDRAAGYRIYLARIYAARAGTKVKKFGAGDVARITARYFQDPKKFRPDPRDAAELEESLRLSDLAMQLLPNADDRPATGAIRKELSEAWMNRAVALMLLGRFTEALMAWDQARPFSLAGEREVVESAASLTLKASEVEQHSLPWSGPTNPDHGHASEMAEYLAQRPGTPTGGIFNASCTLALASRDEKASSNERARRADRAMFYLLKLADGGYFRRPLFSVPGIKIPGIKDTIGELRTDKDLDALRNRKDFRKLLDRFSDL